MSQREYTTRHVYMCIMFRNSQARKNVFSLRPLGSRKPEFCSSLDRASRWGKEDTASSEKENTIVHVSEKGVFLTVCDSCAPNEKKEEPEETEGKKEGKKKEEVGSAKENPFAV